MTSCKHLVLAALALALSASPCLAATDTAEHKLANGMRVIVKPDRRAPVVVVMLLYQVGSVGGRDNAFTSNDYTGYFAVLQKSRLELALRLEADRMANLTLAGEEFAKEIKVVMEERRSRTDDRPRSLVYEQVMRHALP